MRTYMNHRPLAQYVYNKAKAFPSALNWAIGAMALFYPSILSAQTVRSARSCDTPLIAAIHEKNMPEIERITKSNVSLDERACGEGETALIEAIVEDTSRIPRIIISAGASVNVSDNKSVTPLMYAAWYCREELIPLLLEKGAEVNAVDSDGTTALMQSVENCPDGGIAALLLRAGAKINLSSKTGDTALTIASFEGNEHAVEVLVANGADLNQTTSEGESALMIARDREVGRTKSHDRIYQFLLEASQINQKK
jgi:ankyrin repeat protein